jgi:uncharacterized protein (DUF488 family)
MSAASQPRQVIGVGYEGKSIDAFIHGLLTSGVQLLVDVRLNAISRKRGFSKRGLSLALAHAGIDYRHVPELGNPGWNRAGFSGTAAELRAARMRFAQMLESEAANALIQEIADAATKGVVAVMCVETDDRACHRYVILDKMRSFQRICPVAV